MADLIRGPAVVLTGADVVYVADVLAAALRERARRNGGVPPRLRQITETLQVAAVQFRADVLAGSDPGTPEFRNAAVEALCVPSAGRWLTVEATATLLGKSTGYVRRLCRSRALHSVRAAGKGAWLIDEIAVLERLGAGADEAA